MRQRSALAPATPACGAGMTPGMALEDVWI